MGFSTSEPDCWNIDQRAFLLRSRLLKCRSKGCSTSIWTVEMSIKGLFYFDRSYWNVNQRAFLFRSKLLKCWSKGFSTSIWLLKCRSKGFPTSIWTVEMLIKGLFYFNLNCWNVNQMAFLLWLCCCLQKVNIWD